jgi:hypothetical protein
MHGTSFSNSPPCRFAAQTNHEKLLFIAISNEGMAATKSNSNISLIHRRVVFKPRPEIFICPVPRDLPREAANFTGPIATMPKMMYHVHN